MSETLFFNVNVIDGTGAPGFSGQVLVKGNRIAEVARDGAAIEAPNAETVDGAGATLMPGLTDAHGHLSFLDSRRRWATSICAVGASATCWKRPRTPAMTARSRLHQHVQRQFRARAHRDIVALRDAINAGDIPGPRLKASPRGR